MNTENYHRHEGHQQGFSDGRRTGGIMSKPKKIRVRPDNTVVLTCTNCGFQKEAQAESFKDYKHAVRIKCRCQKTFMVFLEYRNRVRKKKNKSERNLYQSFTKGQQWVSHHSGYFCDRSVIYQFRYKKL